MALFTPNSANIAEQAHYGVKLRQSGRRRRCR